jgi:phage shock protein E
MKIPVLLLALQISWLLSVRAAEPPAHPDGHSGTAPAASAPGVKNVGVPEFENLRHNPQAVVLDVRTPKEFAAGHIPGATNIDVNAPDFEQKVAGLSKDSTYLVHCAAGVRSAKACDKLSRLHFKNLYNLEGGFRAWQKEGNQPQK